MGGYFRGWYFKCCTGEKTIAFIPAYHRKNGKTTASVQIITDHAAYRLPAEALNYRETPLAIRIGNCSFGETGIHLNLQHPDLRASGSLFFHALSPIRYPIMGPFTFVPFMQCRHSVYSMKHQIDGQILLNDQPYDFQNGIGYLEGDRGVSFPQRYIWTQCCFENGSLMLSVADIPLLGWHFTGIIGIVLLKGKEYRLATYLGARVKHIGENTVVVQQGDYAFSAELVQYHPQPLYAPIQGNMCRTIHESAACTACYRFSYQKKTLLEFISDQAAFEFEYPLP